MGVQSFTFFIGVLQPSENPQGWLRSHHFIIGCTQRNEDAGNCISYFLKWMGNILPSSFFWVTAKLLVTWISPIYLVDTVIFLFLVLLKEMWLMDKHKILSFLFLVLREWDHAVSSRFPCVTSGLEKFSWEVLEVGSYNLVCLECL